jgi:hypothetical protein
MHDESTKNERSTTYARKKRRSLSNEKAEKAKRKTSLRTQHGLQRPQNADVRKKEIVSRH